jgi:N-acetylglucosamine repressor
MRTELPYYRRVHWRDAQIARPLNQQHVLIVLREGEALSISEISRLTGLSLSTIKTVINDLIGMNLVREVGEGYSTGGRRPTIYSLNTDDNFVIGAEIKRDQLRIGLCSADGQIRAKYAYPTEGRDPQGIADFAAKKIRTVLGENGLSESNIVGLGVSQLSLVNLSGERTIPRSEANWKAYPLGHHLSRAVPFPAFFLEDTNARMIAEADYGRIKNSQNALYVQISQEEGRGIRGSLLCHNLLVLGEQGFSGEIGHIVLDPNGPLCACGQRGCWEAIGSLAVLKRKIEAECGAAKDSNIDFVGLLAERLESRDKQLEVLFDWFVDIQAQGIAALIHVFNPEIIAIGGDIAPLGDVFLDKVKRRIDNRAMKPFLKSTSVEMSLLGDDSALLGAAAFVLQHAVDIKRGITVRQAV